MKKIILFIISLALFACGPDENQAQFASNSDWPLEEIDKMLKECNSSSTDEFNIDLACSCLVDAVSNNINYNDFKLMQSNDEGVFLPAEIEMQEDVIKAMLDCVE